MSRVVSQAARRAAFAQESDDPFLYLVTIDHPNLAAPIRVTSDGVDTRRGPATTADATANGNDGTLQGGVRWAPGLLGASALRFDGGAGSFVDLGDAAALDFGTGDFTLSFLIRTTALTGGIMSKGEDRMNLMLWSEAIDDAAWLKSSNVTITPDAGVAPDGSMTADEAAFNGSFNTTIIQSFTATRPDTQYTMSVWLRLVSGTPSADDKVRIAMFNGDGLLANVSNTIGSDLTSSWQRFEATATSDADGGTVNASIRADEAVTLEIWGAQVEPRPAAGPYIKTESAAAGDSPFWKFGLSNGRLAVSIGDGSIRVEGLEGTAAVNDGVQHRVRVAVNRTNGTAKLFVDNAPDATLDVSAVTGSVSNAGTAEIGRARAGPFDQEPFDGVIDDGRVFDVERLGDDEAAELTGTEANLVGYWKMNEGEVFVPFPFALAMPEEQKDRLSRARFRIGNVKRDVLKTLRQITTPPTVSLEVVLASTPGVVEAGPFVFTLVDVDWDALFIEGDVSFADILNRRFPSFTFNPVDYPALF